MPHNHQITQEMHRCIEYCLECHAICVEAITHCLELGGKHPFVGQIGVLQDCAQICQTSADFMLRGSGRDVEISRICADICERCADDCDHMAPGDETLKRCAEICRRCASSCLAMAAAGVRS